jgi:hypothetical protein
MYIVHRSNDGTNLRKGRVVSFIGEDLCRVAVTEDAVRGIIDVQRRFLASAKGG